MKGWHKESYRHYLASKGIKTNKYFAKRYNSSIVLGGYKRRPFSRFAASAPPGKDKIVIHNLGSDDVDEVSGVIAHEELHNVLAKDVGKDASLRLDNVQLVSNEFDVEKSKMEREIFDFMNDDRYVTTKRDREDFVQEFNEKFNKSPYTDDKHIADIVNRINLRFEKRKRANLGDWKK